MLQKQLSYEQLKDIADRILENIVTLPEEFNCIMTNNAIHPILTLMPVMLVKNEKYIFSNLREFA